MSADEGGDAASMPAANGELNPTTASDPPALSTTGKRKRVHSQDEKSVQDPNSPTSQAQEKTKLQDTLQDLMETLNQNDKDLQLLTCPLPSSFSKPRSKRAKISDDKDESTATTIQSRVASGRYNTVQEFLSDIEKASAAIIERNQAQGAVANGVSADGAPLTQVVNNIAAFKKVLNSLLRQAPVNKSDIKMETSEDDTEAPPKSSDLNSCVRGDKKALTLFGNPANPRQLYSSAQKSTKIPTQSSETGTQQSVEVQAPLRDTALPNGITATKISPYKFENAPKETRKFGEVFTPRASLPQLEPPRKPKPSTRSWIDPFDAVTDIRKFPGDWSNYSLAYLPSGSWLQYGGITTTPTHGDRRQKSQSSKQYDGGHANHGTFEDSARWSGDDPTVLQSVYSSFAPSFDSSGAIMQEDAKDLVWWGTKGRRRLETLLSLPSDEDSEAESAAQPTLVGPLDESLLEESVKTFNPEGSADEIARIDASKDTESTDLGGILDEVSELLDTLSSYQKIRSLDLPTASNQSVKAADKPDLGDASTPSAAEQSVYETLKSSLFVIISNLPPYAVSKLDGDQLADLNISQKLLVDNPDYHGTLEKDDFTLQQARASAVAQGAIGTGRTSTSRTKSYQGSQSGYNQRMYSANSRVPQAQQYYGGRQPATSGAFSPGPSQRLATPATPSQRPSYTAPYSTPQYNLQRTGQSGYTPYSTQQGQASPQPYAARTSHQYSSSLGGARSNSPQKQPVYGSQSRTPYLSSGSNNLQQRYSAQQQQQQPASYTNYSSNRTQPPSANYTSSAAATSQARSTSSVADPSQGGSATPHSVLSRQQSQNSEQERSATPARKQNATPVPS